MITLKLGVYTEEERKTLAILLGNARMQMRSLSPHCLNNTCEYCPMRHLCVDLLQAHTYAKDYVVKK